MTHTFSKSAFYSFGDIPLAGPLPLIFSQLLMGYTRLVYGQEVRSKRAVAQTNRLPFDRLRANDDMLKSCDFSAHAELVEA